MCVYVLTPLRKWSGASQLVLIEEKIDRIEQCLRGGIPNHCRPERTFERNVTEASNKKTVAVPGGYEETNIQTDCY